MAVRADPIPLPSWDKTVSYCKREFQNKKRGHKFTMSIEWAKERWQIRKKMRKKRQRDRYIAPVWWLMADEYVWERDKNSTEWISSFNLLKSIVKCQNPTKQNPISWQGPKSQNVNGERTKHFKSIKVGEGDRSPFTVAIDFNKLKPLVHPTWRLRGHKYK